MPEHNKRIEINVRAKRSMVENENLTQRRKDAKGMPVINQKGAKPKRAA
jgi:hypothetical protein